MILSLYVFIVGCQKSSPQNYVTYFISLKVSKGLGICVTHNTTHVKDWFKDTFTAHSLVLPNEC